MRPTASSPSWPRRDAWGLRHDAARNSAARGDGGTRRYLAGKVAGQPSVCLPNYRAQRHGGDRRADGRCSATAPTGSGAPTSRAAAISLGRPGYALVTRQFGGNLCQGEIAR